jgi:hypothetical protein
MRHARHIQAAAVVLAGALAAACEQQTPVAAYNAAAAAVATAHCALCAPADAACRPQRIAAFVPGSEACVTSVLDRDVTARAELDCLLGAMQRQRGCVEASTDCGGARLCDAAFKTEATACPPVSGPARVARHDCECASCAGRCDEYRCHDCGVCGTASGS